MFNILDLLRDVGATIGTDNNQCEVVIVDVNKWRSFVTNLQILNQDAAKLLEERNALQAKLDSGVRVEAYENVYSATKSKKLNAVQRTGAYVSKNNATLILDEVNEY